MIYYCCTTTATEVYCC